VDRVSLDANVLFSAAYRPSSGLTKLWGMARVRLVTSGYAATEAARNLAEPEQHERLARLLNAVEVTTPQEIAPLPLRGTGLPEKDLPILEAAVAADCSHLLTGDHRHFGQLFGTTVCGVLVQTPAQYISGRAQVSK